MAQKSKAKAKGKTKADPAAEEAEEPLYAILLADSFETRMSPFNLEIPRCLMPLANTPLIEYTMTWLFHSQVNRVHVYCGAHRKQVEDYLKNTKWMTCPALFQEVKIVESSAMNVGDVMRELDSKGFLKSEFVVVHGDVVCNIPLSDALDAHQKKRAKDKNAIMTMVVRNNGSQTEHSWPGAPVIAYDPENKRLLAYQQDDEEEMNLDPDILGEFSDVEITGNLIDPSIDICTPDVLALWSDNFDFQRPRKHFLHQVLKDYELNGKRVFLHILDKPGQFAYRAQHLRSYDNISNYVLKRFSHPYCPDMNFLPEQRYELHMKPAKFIYLDRDVILSQSCKLGTSVVIGAGTKLGESVSIEKSVIGTWSNIGAKSVIENSYLWGNNSIGSGTTITHAILGHGVQVGSNCVIEPGALIGNNVIIANGVIVKANSKITMWKQFPEDDSHMLHALITDSVVVGSGGQGALFEDDRNPSLLENDDPEAEEILIEKANGLVSDKSYVPPPTLKSSLDEAAIESQNGPKVEESDAESEAPLSTPPSPTHPSDFEFHREASTSLLTSLRRSDTSVNIQVELNSLRLASNASEHAVRRAVAIAFATFFVENVQNGGANVKEIVEKTISEHKTLLGRTLFDKKEEEKADQEDLLFCFQKSLLAPLQHEHDDGSGDKGKLVAGDFNTAGNILLHLVTSFVSHDVLEAEGVEAWWESPQSSATEQLKAVRERTKAVVDYLLQSDDEDEDEEESDED